MKIAVISDTHDNLTLMEKAIAVANREHCEYLLHLGDIVAPFAAMKLREFAGIVRAVFGNNDGEIMGLSRIFTQIGGEIERPPLTLELDGRRIAMMHEPYLLDELAASGKFDYLFYGHLHKPDFRRMEKTIVLNPGDASGWMKRASFYLVDTRSDDFLLVEL